VGYWEVKRDLYHVCDSVSFDYDMQQVESFWKWVNRVKYMRIAGVAGKVSSLQSYQSFKGYSNTCGATIWDWIFVKFPVLFFSFHTARVFWKPVKGWTAFGQLQLRARTIDFISRLCWFDFSRGGKRVYLMEWYTDSLVITQILIYVLVVAVHLQNPTYIPIVESTSSLCK
jgi:hypothetical protein